MIDIKKLEECLNRVEKPARYIGGELNSTQKDFNQDMLKFAFCFPDVYEVGMSHLGLQILYAQINEEEDILCERVFAPWIDMEEEMRKRDIPLFSLESKEELTHFDVVGFTLQYEMSYTNIINMLNLAEIPPYRKERGEDDPIIIAGGPCANTPEPLADFIDLFLIGDGEEINIPLFKVIQRGKREGKSKEEILFECTQLQGIYAPIFYDVNYLEDGRIESIRPNREGIPEKIKRVRVSDFSNTFIPDRQIVPFIDTVHDRAVLELFRGCTQGCRFCQAGMMYRPIRERTPEVLMKTTKKLIENTGYDEVSLTSLSSCDYTELMNLVNEMVDEFEDEKVGITLPSLRLDTFVVDTLKEIEKVRKSGLTFAPEAGTQRLRDVINKGVTEEDLMKVSEEVFNNGWSRVKLYFMIGLPTETTEDVMGIADLGYKVKDIFFKRPKEMIRGNFQVTLSVSCFVPKGFTPFQWVGQDSIDLFYEKIDKLKEEIRDPKVKFNYHDPKLSRMEAVIARGDRKTGDFIYRVWEKGEIFSGWSEYFHYDQWEEALIECGLDGDFYANRKRDKEEVFPWDMIDVGVSKAYLWREYERSLDGEYTKDCRLGCNRCGIEECEMWGTFHGA